MAVSFKNKLKSGHILKNSPKKIVVKPERLKSEKQDLVLKLLEPDFKSIPELLVLLKKQDQLEIPERTLRRWLLDFLAQGLIEKTGQKRATKYRIKKPENTNQKSELAIAYISQPLFKRKPIGYEIDWLESYEPNQSSYFSPEQIQILINSDQQSLTANKNTPPLAAGTYAKKIYNRLLIDLSYNSSRLEGNTYSLIETERLLLEGISSEHKLDEERVMILNHKEAIRFLVDQAQKISPSVSTIKTLHYLLSDGLVPLADSGQVRKNAVRISGTTYSPLESHQALEIILEKISEKALKIINPFEQSLFLLSHLAYLQAFIDVNKRTSRLAANIPLIKGNWTPLSFNDVSKDEYLSAMISIYELNEPAPLSMLYVQSYLRTVEQYKTISDSINFDEIRVRYRTERRALLREIILNNPSAKKLALLIKTSSEQIPEGARNNFLEDLQEDLDSLGPHQLPGLGLNQEDLDFYLKNKP